ncbi:MAG: hypothetical protein IRY97_07305, partial [Thermomicrobiaceae bacterium]|nr:hypothetical protein [Thermomicrobiaceae bacterium]
DDVKFSLERATDPALASGDGASLPAQLYLSDIAGATDRMAGRASGLSGVEVVDRRTVRITLQAPAANFLLKLAGPSGDIVDRDNVGGGDWWRKPNGSGPFALTGWRARDRITLQAHQGYRPHPPTLKTVVILLGANALSPMALYERGQIDLTEVPIDDLDRVSAPTNPMHAQLVEQPLFSASYILINPNVPPFDSPQLRRALIQGFDRGKVASATFNGQVRAASGILPPGLLSRDWPATVPPYDLAAAKALLAQASGGKPPSSLTFYTAGSPALVSMKQVYERDLGLAVEVDELDWPDYMADMDAGRLPVFELSWVADYPDPEDFLRTLFYSTSPSNFIQYRNPDVDRLLDQAAKEMDPDRRAQLMSQAQQRIIDDGVVIPLYYDVSRMLIKPQIHGVTVTPLGILGLESVWVTR